MLRLLSLQLALVSLAALSACASGGNNQSVQQAARAACEQRQTSPQDMDACMDEMTAALQRANVPQPPQRQSPPPAPH